MIVDGEETVARRRRLRSMYPYEQVFNNRFYLYLEMAYEFVIGSRVISRFFLDICEIPVTGFFTEYQAASDFKVDENETEGFFLQLDTLTLLTPLMENCWQTYWRTGDSFRLIYFIN